MDDQAPEIKKNNNPDGPDIVEEPGTNEERTVFYRKLFQTSLARISRDRRVEIARGATGDTLCALCFDPDPGVIGGVMENPQTGAAHARLIARHHRNPVGLNAIYIRFPNDVQVKRLLLRNSLASDTLFQKIMNVKSLVPMYQLSLSRELTERAKHNARLVVRRKFQQGSAEECAALIFNTAGRCLNMMVGLSLGSGTAMLLCRRSYSSSLLIQNLARFPGTPPTLIQHLFRQPLVRRNFQLKKMLLRHPNCPDRLKR